MKVLVSRPVSLVSAAGVSLGNVNKYLTIVKTRYQLSVLAHSQGYKVLFLSVASVTAVCFSCNCLVRNAQF